MRLHRSPASASHDLNQAGGMKENGPANKPHRSCTRETPPIRDEVFEDLEYVRLSRAQTNPSGSVPNSWLVLLFFPTARIRTVTKFLRRNRLLLNRSASIASAYGFSEVRRGAEGRKGTENGFVCVRHRTKSSLPTFDRRSIELWAGPAGQGVAGGRGRELAHRYCTGQKEVPCKLRLRKSPALGIWNDSQTPEHWCQLPSRGMGRDLAVRQSKLTGFVDHVNAAECRGEEDHLKISLPYISTVFTRR